MKISNDYPIKKTMTLILPIASGIIHKNKFNVIDKARIKVIK